MDPAALRAEFPVLERIAYLNAGTDGPLAAAAVRFAQAELEAELTRGGRRRTSSGASSSRAQLRAGYARVMGAAVEDVALTTSTSEGIGAVMAGMDLGPGDEIVSSDQEHPGVIGPLKAARDRGATIRLVPFSELANAVARHDDARGLLARRLGLGRARAGGARAGRRARDPRRRAGLRRRAGRRAARSTAPPTRPPARSGCAAATAPGCSTSPPAGASGSGRSPPATSPSRTPRAGSSRPTSPTPAATTRRRSRARPRRCRSARWRCSSATASTRCSRLGREQAATLARRLAGGRPHRRPARRQHARRLGGRRPRGHARPPARRAGVVVRNLPGRPLLRASVGAWNDERDLERLLAALTPDTRAWRGERAAERASG